MALSIFDGISTVFSNMNILQGADGSNLGLTMFVMTTAIAFAFALNKDTKDFASTLFIGIMLVSLFAAWNNIVITLSVLSFVMLIKYHSAIKSIGSAIGEGASSLKGLFAKK